MILLNLRSFGLPDISLAKSFITDEENDDCGGFNERLRIFRWESKANEKKTTGLWLLSKLPEQRREFVSKSSALGTRDMSLNIGLKEMSHMA
jgi:hypothetical protein